MIPHKHLIKSSIYQQILLARSTSDNFSPNIGVSGRFFVFILMSSTLLQHFLQWRYMVNVITFSRFKTFSRVKKIMHQYMDIT